MTPLHPSLSLSLSHTFCWCVGRFRRFMNHSPYTGKMWALRYIFVFPKEISYSAESATLTHIVFHWHQKLRLLLQLAHPWEPACGLGTRLLSFHMETKGSTLADEPAMSNTQAGHLRYCQVLSILPQMLPAKCSWKRNIFQGQSVSLRARGSDFSHKAPLTKLESLLFALH